MYLAKKNLNRESSILLIHKVQLKFVKILLEIYISPQMP
jgi:hypothetical protein